MEVVIEINQMRQVMHKHRNMKKCYCCASGMHMLNDFKIIYKISIYQWFERTGNLQIRHQQV